MFLEATDKSKVDSCTHREVEGNAVTLLHGKEAARQPTSVQVTLLDIFKDTSGYFQPFLSRQKRLFFTGSQTISIRDCRNQNRFS